MSLIYLDYNATTPLDEKVVEAMRPFLHDIFGNPSSIHSNGVKARKSVEYARKQVAGLLHCFTDEIIFTSGGSESNNLAIKGMAYRLRNQGNHIITSAIEHPAVTEVCRFLEKDGFRITYLPVDANGRVNPEDLEKEITPQTILITIMHANNETGSIQPIAEIGKIAKERNIIFHTDAAQSVGKIPIDVNLFNIDLLSVAGHKLYGPKGVGALFIRRGVKPEKLIHGADHEQNLRAGTENIMSIAGLGMACEIAAAYLQNDKGQLLRLRNRLEQEILEKLPEVKLNGDPELRLPNTVNLSFPGVEAALMLSKMPEIEASAGAACHSGSEVISPVLKAMGVSDYDAMGSIRFSLGRMTTQEDIERVIPVITGAYKKLSGNRDSSGVLADHPEKILLTHYTHSLGCACKMDPLALQELLKSMPVTNDPAILVGFETSDDAAVYRINESTVIVQTVDMIPPVVDDPYSFGAIAAANALSDVYAMGGKPLFALSVVGFPVKILPQSVLLEIIKGANDKVAEAGIRIIGGHSIEDTEPKFGLIVTGTVDAGKILKNSGAKPGDAIILTKPIGTGIISTGIKRGLVETRDEEHIIAVMSELNNKAAEVMARFPVNACTDVSGFGLLGHLKEMVTGSGNGATILVKEVPFFPAAVDLITANVIPGGTLNNKRFVASAVRYEDHIPESSKIILSDAQTSGGLLIALPQPFADGLLKALHDAGILQAVVIGSFTEGTPLITVK